VKNGVVVRFNPRVNVSAMLHQEGDHLISINKCSSHNSTMERRVALQTRIVHAVVHIGSLVKKEMRNLNGVDFTRSDKGTRTLHLEIHEFGAVLQD
jgi:hypothetical protein